MRNKKKKFIEEIKIFLSDYRHANFDVMVYNLLDNVGKEYDKIRDSRNRWKEKYLAVTATLGYDENSEVSVIMEDMLKFVDKYIEMEEENKKLKEEIEVSKKVRKNS